MPKQAIYISATRPLRASRLNMHTRSIPAKYSVLACTAASLMANAVTITPVSAQSTASRGTEVTLSEARQHCAAQAQAYHPFRIERAKKSLAGHQEIFAKREQELARTGRTATDWDRRGVTSYEQTVEALIKGGPDALEPGISNTPLQQLIINAHAHKAAELPQAIKSLDDEIQALKRKPGPDQAAELAAEEQRRCVYVLRDRKLKGLPLGSPASAPVVAAAPAPNTANNAAAKPGARSLGQQEISACSDEIRRLQLESQSWTGNVNDNAARLGRMQKDLFEGRCAGHPEAAAYIAGANRMLGYQTAAGGSAQQGASGQSRTAAAAEQHNRAHDAKHCIKVYGPAEMKAMGMHGVLASKIVNTCAFPVSVTWCVASSATRRGDCNPGYSNLHNLSAAGDAKGSNSYGVDAVNQTVHYGACRYGKDMGFIRVELDRQNPFRFACK